MSILFSVAVAEAAVRILDGYPLFAFPLGAPKGRESVETSIVDSIPVQPGVERAWFYADPPPLPNRKPVAADWQKLFHELEDRQAGSAFRPSDIFKAWNTAFMGPDPCKQEFLRQAPGQLWVYDPPDGAPRPPYRYIPDATQPIGLVVNQMGWRGAPIQVPRGDKVIRIVFVGSSTTAGPAHLPFSYPEYVGYWLNRWAEARKLPVRFEVLNAGRESIVSTDTAAIVRTEVLPLKPDLVVYYEGGNQFYMRDLLADLKTDVAPPPSAAPDGAGAGRDPWLQAAARYSALAGRVRTAIGAAGTQLDGREPAKPDYRLAWPAGLDEQDPDLAYPKLPINLNTITRDLDEMRSELARQGSDFAVSSFLWMVKDGMVLDPVRHRFILDQLNISYFPYRYRDMQRLSDFQNRFLAKYARSRGIGFIDNARYFPLEPDLFVDAVHTTWAGLRLHAWIAFNQLLPIVEKHLADGSWPRPSDPATAQLPTIAPRKITFDCR